ncbi:MAG: GDP-mannose 4,6-dehydratase [Candidatus Methylacidiphilales bacterium]|nr:GDP-mannose 4,6-dehydratase [Candidatus Methylacidiphilales bacterium]
MKYLITGGCGFVGCNIAARLIAEGADVTVFDNLSRAGSEANLAWLRTLGRVAFVSGDIRNREMVESLVGDLRPGVIFHLAGQVAMTTSMADPRKDFEINVVGSINLLEAVRVYAPAAAVIYSSSNKAYGDLGQIRLEEKAKRYEAPDHPMGLDESTHLDFHTPYGCSKGAADQYMLDYARSFGLNTVVFRHSTIYGGRQFSTYDQGWVGWFCRQAVETMTSPGRAPFTISGDGKQVRDLLYVEDVVDCYLAAAKKISTARGQAFNIGGGMANSSSILELLDGLEARLRVKLSYTHLPWRHDDQRFFVANNTKAKSLLHWVPRVAKEDGVERTIDWVKKNHGP